MGTLFYFTFNLANSIQFFSFLLQYSAALEKSFNFNRTKWHCIFHIRAYRHTQVCPYTHSIYTLYKTLCSVYHTRAFFVTKLHLRYSYPPCCIIITNTVIALKLSLLAKKEVFLTNERTKRYQPRSKYTPHTNKMRGKDKQQKKIYMLEMLEWRTLKNVPSFMIRERDDKEKKFYKHTHTRIRSLKERETQTHT